MAERKSEADLIGRITPFGLRMRPELKAEIEASAKENGRSLNSEIVSRLTRAATEQEPGVSDKAKSSTITVRLTEDMRNKLDELSVRGPYRISITSIIDRGIELAAKELETLNAKGGA